MKLIHAQIYGALVSVLLVGSLLWALSLRAETRNHRLEASRLRAQLQQPKPERPDPQDKARIAQLELEVTTLAQRLEILRAENERLTRDREQLREALASGGSAATASAAGAKPRPGTPLDHPSGPPRYHDGPTGPPPVVAPPPAPRNEPWGASSTSELDELTAALNLSREQRDEVQKIVMEGQNDFERRLIEAGQRGEHDISIIERIGREVSERTESRIRQLLFPEQQRAFDEYLRDLEER